MTGGDLLTILGIAVLAGTLVAVMHKEPPRQALRYMWLVVKAIATVWLLVWFLATLIHGRWRVF